RGLVPDAARERVGRALGPPRFLAQRSELRVELLVGADANQRERDPDPLFLVAGDEALHELVLDQVLVRVLARAQDRRKADRPLPEGVEPDDGLVRRNAAPD